jgi:hypothetical protein
MIIMQSATVACFICDFVDTGPVYKVSVLWTTNGWSTTTKVDLDTFPSSAGRNPKMRLGTDGRIRAMWADDQNSTNIIPVLAYSDDYGQTWTIIGTPAILDGEWGYDESYNIGFAIGQSNTWFVTVLDGENEAGPYYHRLFTGGDSLLGWALRSCELTFTAWSGATAGESFLFDGDFYRVYDEITGDNNEVNFLREEGVDEPPTEPPLVVVSPTGSDVNNVYLRLRLAERRGWSVHDLIIDCFALWPEGDYTTQRRLDTLVAAAGLIDPRVDDPAHLPAIYKIDDKERYTREIFATDSGNNTIVRADPFRFYMETADIPFGGDFNIGLLRGVLIRYRRAFADFTVEFLVDGEVVQTEVLSPSWPEPVEVFLPALTDDNAGQDFRLRIVDETEYPLIIEALAPQRIDKGVRG